MSTFKERIRELRLETGLGQKELGKLLGYSESTLSLYETGLREPKRIVDLIRIADYFNVTLDYLLGRSNDKSSFAVKDGEFKSQLDKLNQEKEKNNMITEKIKEIMILFSDK